MWSAFKGCPTKTYRHHLATSLMNAMKYDRMLDKNYVMQVLGHSEFATTEGIYGNHNFELTSAEEEQKRIEEKAKAEKLKEAKKKEELEKQKKLAEQEEKERLEAERIREEKRIAEEIKRKETERLQREQEIKRLKEDKPIM